MKNERFCPWCREVTAHREHNDPDLPSVKVYYCTDCGFRYAIDEKGAIIPVAEEVVKAK